MDTAGCILVGQDMHYGHGQFGETPGVWRIGHSRLAFEQLMNIQKELNKFELIVEEAYELDHTKLE